MTVLKVSVVLLREVYAFIESIVESNDWTMTGANTKKLSVLKRCLLRES